MRLKAAMDGAVSGMGRGLLWGVLTVAAFLTFGLWIAGNV